MHSRQRKQLQTEETSNASSTPAYCCSSLTTAKWMRVAFWPFVLDCDNQGLALVTILCNQMQFFIHSAYTLTFAPGGISILLDISMDFIITIIGNARLKFEDAFVKM